MYRFLLSAGAKLGSRRLPGSAGPWAQLPATSKGTRY